MPGSKEVMTSKNNLTMFVTAPLISSSKPVSLSPLQRVRPRPRSRCITPSARSLDSYREGMRFQNSSPQDSSNEKSPIPNQKAKIALVKAMVKMNVASHGTCEFLVRKGCVRVNGVVVKDEKAKVDRHADNVMVNGTNHGTLDGSHERSDEWVDLERDEGFLPRSQRDFKQERLDGGDVRKKFSRRVDGGFYSSKRYPYGK